MLLICALALALVPAVAFCSNAEPAAAGYNAPTIGSNDPAGVAAGWYIGSDIISPGSYGGAGACYMANDTLWLFALNGDQDGFGTALGELRKYNVNTDAWTDLATDIGRAWTSMVCIGTKLYALGGLPNGAGAWSQMTGDLRCYDIPTDTWTPLTSANVETGSSGMVVYQDSLIYAIGGQGTSGSPINDVQLYNVAGNSWRAATSLPDSRANGWCAILRDTLYYGCGCGPTTGNFNNNIYVGIINPADHASITWTTSSVTFPGTGRHRMDASIFGGMWPTGESIIIGPGAGAVWWGTGTQSHKWNGGTSSFTSIGPVQATSDAMVGAGSYVDGIYRKWRFVIASGLVMSDPYHILTTQVYADSALNGAVNEGSDNALKPSCSLGQSSNPFKSATKISYGLFAPANVKLAVYDALGREVAVLVNGHALAGEHQVTFNAQNLDEGVYFCRIETGNYTTTNKLILVK